jgi:phosphopantetheinyl transferase
MKIEILHTNEISDLDAAFAEMSRERQDSCRRLASPQARLLCVAADVAARRLVGDWQKDDSGKPICHNGYLSLAHSGEYAVAVWDEVPIGVDIEKLRSLSPALAKRLGTEQPLTEWLKREAYGKALGVGVYRVLDDPIPEGWAFSFPDAPDGYTIAICKKQEP